MPRPNTQTIYKKKNCKQPLVLEKNFKELTDRDLKGREMETRREIEQLFLNHVLCLQMIWINLKEKK